MIGLDRSKPLWQEVLALRVVIAILLIGALLSGFVTSRNLRDLAATYRSANTELRLFMLYGPLTPLLAHVTEQTEPSSRILLLTDADPALIAYGLYPRRIWQPTVDAALEPMFVQRSASPYPQRAPESFAVDWFLHLTPENVERGGELRQGRGER